MTAASASHMPHPRLRHLEQLMAQLLDGVIVLDPTGMILSVNRAALAMHGITTAEELGATAEDYARRFTLWTPDGRRLKQREYPLFRVLAGESIPDLVVDVAPAGEEEARWVHQARDVTMDVDGGEPDYLAVVLSDVSERYNAEARFAAMFRANPAPAIIVRQRDLRLVQANPGFLSLTGFAPDRLVNRSLFGLDLLGGLADAAAVRRHMEDGDVVPQKETELLMADGSRRLALFAGQPIDVTGEDALLLTFADLEPRRTAERSLAASERHLQAVFEVAPVAMLITDTAGRITRVNAALRTLTGSVDEQLVGLTADELDWWGDESERDAMTVDLATDGAVHARDARLRFGEQALDCLVSAETIALEGAAHVLWVLQDVTERRRSEADLAEAIDEVLKDAKWLSHSILDKLATLRRPTPQPAGGDLSAREREILELICDDLDDAVIAERLGIARNTVRNHVARIYAKTGSRRRSAAVVWGRERGMGSGA